MASSSPEGHCISIGVNLPVFKNVSHHSKSFEILNTMRQQELLCDVTVRVSTKDILGKILIIINDLSENNNVDRD